MPVTLVEAKESERSVIDNLLQLYLHELSRFEEIEIGESGRYSYHHLEAYWQESGRIACLIRVKGKLAGFALVRDEKHGIHTVAEFFVLENYRRLGIGEEICRLMFERHPGAWEISVLAENEVAIAFWRTVVRRYTGKKFEEASAPGWLGPIFRFCSPATNQVNQVRA